MHRQKQIYCSQWAQVISPQKTKMLQWQHEQMMLSLLQMLTFARLHLHVAVCPILGLPCSWSHLVYPVMLCMLCWCILFVMCTVYINYYYVSPPWWTELLATASYDGGGSIGSCWFWEWWSICGITAPSTIFWHKDVTMCNAPHLMQWTSQHMHRSTYTCTCNREPVYRSEVGQYREASVAITNSIRTCTCVHLVMRCIKG